MLLKRFPMSLHFSSNKNSGSWSGLDADIDVVSHDLLAAYCPGQPLVGSKRPAPWLVPMQWQRTKEDFALPALGSPIGIGGARACPQVDQVFQEEFGTFLLILRVYFVILRVF